MQIYSLTLERLERLRRQIADKKAEHDELEALDEKDLWCKDLDAFVEEWENQMRLDDEIRSNIRKMGRRTSRKIGAGKGARKKAGDDDYDPGKKKTKAVTKKVAVPFQSTQQRLFSTEAKKPKPVGTDGANSDFDDDDFASLKKTASKATTKTTSKPAVAKVPSPVVDISDDDTDFAALAPSRSKRAAAKKPIPVDLSDEEEDDDDDFVVPAPTTSKPAAAKKPSPVDSFDEDGDDNVLPIKPQRKAATAKKPAPIDLSDDDSDSVLPTKIQTKAATAKKPSSDESAPEQEASVDDVVPAAGRSKRAAAVKKKTWVFSDDEDESQDGGDDLLGDVGAMVRGIGEPAAASTNGRLSLFAMSRSEHGNPVVPKLKTKQSRTFDLDSPDDTNYELLAKSSPQKPPEIDELMSDDEEAPAATKTSSAKSKPSKTPLNVVAGQTKKARGRPAGTKGKAKEDKPAKPVQLSPAAKAYAAKTKGGSKAASKGKKNVFDFDDEEDEDSDVLMDDSPPPQPAARTSRPGRAAAKAKTYVVDDDESMSDADDFDEDEESD